MNSPRPYQKECLDAIRSRYDAGVHRQLCVLATSAGKTFIASHLPSMFKSNMLWVVSSDELVLQAQEAFTRAGLSVSIEKAGRTCDLSSDVVVGTIQSLCSKGRLDKFLRDHFGIIGVDEGHLLAVNSFKKVVLDHFRCTKEEIGDRLFYTCTATPNRPDGRSLHEFCDEIVFSKDLVDLQKEGLTAPDGRFCSYIADLKAFRISTYTDLSKIAVRGGDFVPEQLAASVDTPSRNRLILDKYLELTPGLPVMGFCAGVKHSENLRDLFLSAGIRSAMVCGDTSKLKRDERRRIIEQCRTGEIVAVFSALALGVGTDIPLSTVCMNCSPTLSSLKFRQQVGRVCRPFPAPEERITKPDSAFSYIKESGIILDFVDNTVRHKLQTASSMFGLPAAFDCEGKSVRACAREFQAKQQSLPLADLAGIRNLEDLQTVTESVNLFASHESPPELARLTRNLWTRDSTETSYRLVMTNMVWEVREDKLGDWRLYERQRGVVKELWREGSLRAIINAADCLVCAKGEDFQLIDGRASWRKHPPTEAQCHRLWKEAPYLRKDFRNPQIFYNYATFQFYNNDKRFSKGGISLMLDRLKLSKEGQTA